MEHCCGPQHMISLVHAETLNDCLQLCSPSRVGALRTHYLLHDVKVANRADLQSIFQNNAQRMKIFPENIIVIEGCLYEPVTDNLDILLDPAVICVMFVTKDAQGHIESLSLGFTCPCELGLRYDINYYGPDNKVDLIISHFVQHFTNVNKEESGTGGLWMNVLVSKRNLEEKYRQELLHQRNRIGMVLADAIDREQVALQVPFSASSAEKSKI